MIVLIIIIVIIVITNSNSSNNDSNNGLCTDLSKQDKVYSTPKDPHWVSWGEKPFLYRGGNFGWTFQESAKIESVRDRWCIWVGKV